MNRFYLNSFVARIVAKDSWQYYTGYLESDLSKLGKVGVHLVTEGEFPIQGIFCTAMIDSVTNKLYVYGLNGLFEADLGHFLYLLRLTQDRS